MTKQPSQDQDQEIQTKRPSEKKEDVRTEREEEKEDENISKQKSEDEMDDGMKECEEELVENISEEDGRTPRMWWPNKHQKLSRMERPMIIKKSR